VKRLGCWLVILIAVSLPLYAGTQTTGQQIPEETLQTLGELNQLLEGMQDGVSNGEMTPAEFRAELDRAFDAFEAVIGGLPEVHGVPFADVFARLFEVLFALNSLGVMHGEGNTIPNNYLATLDEGLSSKNLLEWTMGGGMATQQLACPNGKALVVVYSGFDCYELKSKIRELIDAGKCVAVTWDEPLGFTPTTPGAAGPVATQVLACLGSTFQTGPTFQLDPKADIADPASGEAYTFGDATAMVRKAAPVTSSHPALKDSALALETSRGTPTVYVDPAQPLQPGQVIHPWYSIDNLCSPVDIEWRYYGPGGTLAYVDKSSLDPMKMAGTNCLSNYASSGWTSLNPAAFGTEGVYNVELWFGGQYSALHTLRMAGSGPLDPIVFDDFYTTDEDTVLNATDRPLTGNDADPNGDPLSVELATPPGHGNVVLNPDGTFEYTPSTDFYGVDWFTYSASDPGGLSSVGEATILVNPANDAPLAQDDVFWFAPGADLKVEAWTISTQSGTWTQVPTLGADGPTLTIPRPGVLANDRDPDNDLLVVSDVTIPDEYAGAVMINGDGSAIVAIDKIAGFVQTPAGTYRPITVSGDYVVSDGHGLFGQGSFTFEFQAPAAQP